MNKKIISLNRLAKIAKDLRANGKRIATINGSFDILHSGHARLLAEAKRGADKLAVLLNSDVSIRKYKGPDRPIITELERASLLSALECVDFVVLFDDINPIKALEKVKPDVHCNGSDWGKYCVERDAVLKNGGKIKIIKLKPGLSSSKIIEKAIRIAGKPAVKAVFIDRDGTLIDNSDYYVYRKEKVRYLQGVIEGLQKLSKSSYKIILVTNQSGIGKGIYKKNDVEKLNRWMIGDLKSKNIRIDRIYYCPHTDKDRCLCRKPGIGMLTRAVEELKVNLSKSWLIGDDERDVLAGRRANVKTVKLGEMPKRSRIRPGYVCKDFLEAVELILSRNDHSS